MTAAGMQGIGGAKTYIVTGGERDAHPRKQSRNKIRSLMMRGRKPTPTHLKIVAGNPGKRPLPIDEPKPEGKAVRPKFLRGRAAELWDEYAPKLEAMGVLTDVDAHLFAAWCSLAAEMEKRPMSPAGVAQFRGLSAAFGMEPSARARLGMKPRTKADPAQEFVGRGDPAARYFEP
jgi:phage terminase small subunit